jgi:hypothetical protein
MAEKLNSEGKWNEKSAPLIQIEKKKQSISESTSDIKANVTSETSASLKQKRDSAHCSSTISSSFSFSLFLCINQSLFFLV